MTDITEKMVEAAKKSAPQFWRDTSNFDRHMRKALTAALSARPAQEPVAVAAAWHDGITYDRIERMMVAVEGECEGLAIDAGQAMAILAHVFAPTALSDRGEDSTPSPVDHLGVAQDISTAPANTDVLVWWPIVKLDDDGDPTEEVVGGCWLISEDQGGYWIEPDVMNAIGDHMGDDYTYADKPSQWMPLPTPLFTAASEGSTDE